MNKIGAGIYENTNEAIQAGLAFPGPLLLYETALDAAQDIRATPDHSRDFIIGRINVDSEQQGWLRSIEPARYGLLLAERLLAHPANPYLDGWQSLNEINDKELRKAQAEFDYAFAFAMLLAQKKAVIGNFSVGNFNAEEILEWQMAFALSNVLLGYHAYWPQEGPEMMGQWLAFRYRLWAQYCKERIIKFPKVLLTEYGVDLWNPELHHGRGGFEGKGWKEALNGDSDTYIRQLNEFATAIDADPLVQGATIFCSGDSGGWDSFNIVPMAWIGTETLQASPDTSGQDSPNFSRDIGGDMRTPEQQNAIDVINGWSGKTQHPGNLKEIAAHLRAIDHEEEADLIDVAAIELENVAQIVKDSFPLG